ncbi:hypothetical protein PFISCL1PPCAC_17803, partial [Pristionchus fissidentatus]
KDRTRRTMRLFIGLLILELAISPCYSQSYEEIAEIVFEAWPETRPLIDLLNETTTVIKEVNECKPDFLLALANTTDEDQVISSARRIVKNALNETEAFGQEALEDLGLAARIWEHGLDREFGYLPRDVQSELRTNFNAFVHIMYEIKQNQLTYSRWSA